MQGSASASSLTNITDHCKAAVVLLVGAVILVAIVSIHGTGLHHILRQHKRSERRLRSGKPHLVEARLLLAWAIFLMLALHLGEIIIWGLILQQWA